MKLDAIRARLEAATPGPWHQSDVNRVIQTSHITRDVWTICETREHPIKDTPFIANAPTDIKALLDEVTSLEAKVKELEEYKWKYEELCK